MFRTTNEEPSERQPHTVQSFAPQGSFDLRPRLIAGSPANAAAHGAYLRDGLPPWVVRRVREHIESNIDRRIKVEALAKLANLSVCYFVRAFKQSVGVTPHDHLMRRRVERTMELLSGPICRFRKLRLPRVLPIQATTPAASGSMSACRRETTAWRPLKGYLKKLAAPAGFVPRREMQETRNRAPVSPETLLRRAKETRRRVIGPVTSVTGPFCRRT
jgi:AraC-like DNA-binding protein